MTTNRTCDGVLRRDFLKAGALGLGGLTLPQYLQLAAAGEVNSKAKSKSAIFIHLGGGPTHLDTFDMKPDSPAEYRGEFNPIKTNVPGVEFCEHMPLLAQCADKFAVVRGVTHSLAAHPLGTQYVNSGNRPIPSLEFPGYGAVITRELGGPADLPPFVSIPSGNQRPGYLGVRYAPLNTSATPTPGKPFSVRGMSLQNGLTIADVERREALLGDLDNAFQAIESQNQLLDGLDRFTQQAHSMITSKASREAFDTSLESPAYVKTFGESTFGMSCLLASRLVAAGVRFVNISFGGWDTHQDNFAKLKDKQLPALDQGLSGLFNGLASKGILDSTTVFVTGEFGRTPKINGRGGRDHYARAMFMLLAGGGIRGGQALGASDDKGTGPAGKGFTPDDVAATFYQTLGIDHHKEYQTNIGRPVMILRDGHVIPELLA